MRSTLYICLAAFLSLVPSAAVFSADAQPQAADNSARTGEISNPDDAAMVYLYYDMAGLDIPVEEWVESDQRVTSAPGTDKARARVRVRNEIKASSRAVSNIGLIRLKMNANLSRYDPDYEEFTVLALAPSSSVIFSAHSKKVLLQFSNAQQAQVWKVSREKSQGMIDRIGNGYSININLLAQLQRARPAPRGGVIIAKVLSYELRNSRSGTVVTRVKVAE